MQPEVFVATLAPTADRQETVDAGRIGREVHSLIVAE